jgi:hypothetical protein
MKERRTIGRNVLEGFPARQPWKELKRYADLWLLKELKKDLEALTTQMFPKVSKQDQGKVAKKLLSNHLTKQTVDLLDAYDWDFELVKNAERPGSLISIVEDLAAAVSKLKKRDALRRSNRISSEEARRVIERLDDIQLVIQWILGKWKDEEE